MEFEEAGFPRIGAIKNDSPLLDLVQKWQTDLTWGKFAETANHMQKTVRAIKSYIFQFERIFAGETDYFHLRGQDNIPEIFAFGQGGNPAP